MAENTDQSEKTEDPTPKRLEESRKKGQVATSREVNHWFMLLAGAVALMVLAPGLARNIGETLAGVIGQAGTTPADAGNLMRLVSDVLLDVGLAMLPLLVLLIVAALAAGLIQNGLVISGEPLIPKLEKLSLIKGVKRLFSMKSLVEFTKGVLKIAVVGAVLILVLMPKFDEIVMAATLDIPQVVALLHSLALRMMLAVVSVTTVVAGLDLLYQRWEHQKNLRMSRQEVKEELKQSEGDPLIKGRLRQIRMERARQRMMAKVPDADVVITNPTHYAVALSYVPETMAAPALVAKGTDAVAQRIREVAQEHGVPVVENPPLAQALFATVDLDQEIPSEHYRAVAEIIGYVMGLKRNRPSAP